MVPATPEEEAALAFEAPTRSSNRPRPAAPPELPPLLTQPPRLTVALEFRSNALGSATGQVKTITRGADRVHVRWADANSEWLFVRNPRDPRRVSGTLVDHQRRAIVEYDESELRMGRVARGWADIAGFGVPPEIFAKWQATGRHDTFAGYEFKEMMIPTQTRDGVQTILWSDAAVAPLCISMVGGSEIVARSFAREVDEAVLQRPERRFPSYRVFDVADYREQHHETAAEGHD